MAWRISPEWRELYMHKNFCQATPAFRYAPASELAAWLMRSITEM
jgi:hypothetical protein